jgi:pyridoxamine 5'-phosphate oxidase
VRVYGAVTRVGDDEARAYFAGRPLKSRIGAWASKQSVVLRDRAELEARVAEAAARFGDGEIPKPPFWNGYVVRPDEVELWQGRRSRLHDRLRYERVADGGWRIERLSP